MSKIINKETKEIIDDDDFYQSSGIVLNYFDEHDTDYELYTHLSKLIETMDGEASTPFETIEEMTAYIPGIEKCHEECEFLQVFDDCQWFILGWDHENDTDIWSKILQRYYPSLEVVE